MPRRLRSPRRERPVASRRRWICRIPFQFEDFEGAGGGARVGPVDQPPFDHAASWAQAPAAERIRIRSGTVFMVLKPLPQSAQNFSRSAAAPQAAGGVPLFTGRPGSPRVRGLSRSSSARWRPPRPGVPPGAHASVSAAAPSGTEFRPDVAVACRLASLRAGAPARLSRGRPPARRLFLEEGRGRTRPRRRRPPRIRSRALQLRLPAPVSARPPRRLPGINVIRVPRTRSYPNCFQNTSGLTCALISHAFPAMPVKTT